LTTKGFIFGGFTTAEWESPSSSIFKPCPHSFLFSVNEGRKYPITSADRGAILCRSGGCAVFGYFGLELGINSDSKNNSKSFCTANLPSFKLPAAKGSKGPSMNGGKEYFQVKEFEVYSVLVRISLLT
jgi:hypothetical protein